MTSFYEGKKVLVTGGASFIGSHLTEALVKLGAIVTVVDNLSSGKLSNIEHLINKNPQWAYRSHLHTPGKIIFIEDDLREALDDEQVRMTIADTVIKEKDIVFHLAAQHGGRGYVDMKQGPCANNLLLDGLVFDACRRHNVKVVYASSGCVYPNHIQTDVFQQLYLTEDMVGPPYDADNMYGWAKLMAEMTLKAYHKDYGLKSANCRYFTVYGPRGKEDHAVMAMIGRAFLKKDPFEVWGDGTQVRNWTYVDDIVEGTLLAGEKIDDGTAVNLGTTERTNVVTAAQYVMKCLSHKAEIKLRPDMPSGPVNRIADNTLAKKLLGWEPKVMFKEGVARTINWYVKNRNVEELIGKFDSLLI
jgi:nucleoside-diphosphate-sugar epimerase